MNETSNLPVRREFGASEQLIVRETASSAVAAQAKAMVEARYIMAMQRPRVWDQVRQDILRECKRPSFANNKSAYYNKPIGKGVEGLGIRFTEIALRCMTNVLIETTTVFEDEEKEIIRVSVTDLESNVTYPMDVRVSKTVERSKPMDDGSYISVRMNSYKKPVYTVPANDDDLLNKRGALISKAQRTLALRIVPGDIQDEAEAIIKEVRLSEVARDPDAERKRIADAFADIGVKAADLISYLGHGLDTCSPSELVSLRGLYGAIKDGEATWASVMENKGGEGEPGKKDAPKEPAKAAVAGPERKPSPEKEPEKKPEALPKKEPEPEQQPAGRPMPPDKFPEGDNGFVGAGVDQAPPPDTTEGGDKRDKKGTAEDPRARPTHNTETASPALIQKVRDRAEKFDVSEERILQRHGLSSLEGINTGIANVILAWIMAGAPEK